MNHKYSMVDGIKCYHPNVAMDHLGYPSSGFDVTDEIENESFWVRSRSRLLKREVLKAVSGKYLPSFFEIGCGTGNFLRALSFDSSLRLLGSEIYLRGLQSAVAHQSSNIEYIQLDATEIPFESSFDAVGAFDVLEHIQDDVSVLHGIYRSLKPGGSLILTVPQHQFLWSSLDEFVHHRRRYSRKDLIKKIRSGGFQIEYVSSFVFMLFPLMLISRFLARNKKVTTKNFDNQVHFSPLINWVFDVFMRIDEVMITWRFSLPWGGSLLVVAKK